MIQLFNNRTRITLRTNECGQQCQSGGRAYLRKVISKVGNFKIECT